MPRHYLIVDKRILPKNYEKIIETRALLNQHLAKDISDACKQTGLSRSTFYKFKDLIFAPEDEKTTRKAVLSLSLDHKQGILSDVLHHLAQHQANILTITQNYPIQNQAHVVIMMDIADLMISIESLITELNSMNSVSSVQLISIE